jgi:magnesium-transporting ATPase (P-type)
MKEDAKTIQVKRIENPHLLEYSAVLEFFGVRLESGLSDEKVSEAVKVYGENQLVEKNTNGVWKILAANIFNSMNLILGSALVVSIVIVDWVFF